MQTELKRSVTGMVVPGSPRPYYLLYSLRRISEGVRRAAFGSLTLQRNRQRNAMFVDLRVGNHQFDNMLDAGLSVDSEERESADWVEGPDDLDPLALRMAFWKLTQIHFDEAQQDYLDHRKAMVSEFLKDEVDSLTQERAVRAGEAGKTKETEQPDFEFDWSVWETRLQKVSKRFLQHPEIYDPGIRLRVDHQRRWLVNSEGSRIATEDLHMELAVEGWVLSEDGVYLDGSKILYLRSIEGLPSEEELERLVDEVVEDLHELRQAESPGSFIGPALLAGQSASTVFHEALGHRLEGDRLVARGETRTFAKKRGESILPAGLDIYDDPSLSHYAGMPLWGGYAYDDEGIASRRVSLVEDGVLKDFLRGRTGIPPASSGSEVIGQSNGHGRHDGLQKPMARMANFIVEAPGEAPTWDELKQQLIELAVAQGRSQAAIIKRIRAGETHTSSYDFQVFKGELAEIYLVDVESGEETRVRDLDLIGTPLSVLQRIAAFGGDHECDHGYCYAESGSIPVSGVAPALLLSEVELQPRFSTSFHEPLLPPPFADDGSRGRRSRPRERGRRNSKSSQS